MAAEDEDERGNHFRPPTLTFEPLRVDDLDVPGLKRPFPKAGASAEEVEAWLDVHSKPNEEDGESSLGFSLGPSVEDEDDADAFFDDENAEDDSILARAVADMDEFCVKKALDDEKAPKVAFSTGLGKQISISNSAMEKASKLWNETAQSDEESVTSTVMPKVALAPSSSTPKIAFSTGLGKQIPISKSAMEKAAKLWNDVSPSSSIAEEAAKETPKSALSSARRIGLSRKRPLNDLTPVSRRAFKAPKPSTASKPSSSSVESQEFELAVAAHFDQMP